MDTIHTGRKPHAPIAATVLPGVPALASSLRPAPLRLLLTLALLLVTLLPAHSATQSWNPNGDGSGGNGTWDTGITADWDSGVTWTDSNDALFSGTGGTVNLVTPTANSLTFNATAPYLLQSGTLTLSGSAITMDSDATIASAVNSDTGLFITGNNTLTLTGSTSLGTGILTMDSGALVIAAGGSVSGGPGGYPATVAANIGYDPGSNAAVTVSGSGSSWINNGDVYIGDSGTGTLVISSGASVSDADAWIGYNPNSNGTVTVSGVGSTWTHGTEGGNLFIGGSGSGTLMITAGGAVSDAYGYIGYNPGSAGTATVSGTGSILDSSSLYVGYSGSGSLLISNGGGVSDAYINNGATIGYEPGSTGSVTVIGSGSTWSSGGNIYVGESGTGMLLVSSGGAVSDFNLGRIGDIAGSNGSVTVTGTGSTWTNGEGLIVGLNGTASLLISNGGAVSDNGPAFIAEGSGSGSVTVSGSGSALTITADLSVGTSGSGTLLISSGGAVSSVYSSIGGELNGFGPSSTGTVTVTGSGSTWNSGPLAVGEAGSGRLLVNSGGSVSGSNAILGDQPGSIGTVTVSGPGSSWTNSGSLYIGNSGTGSLLISNGATVSDNAAFVGYYPGSSGAVVVTGSGSKLTVGAGIGIDVGVAGSGSLLIANGATVANGGFGFIGNGAGSTGVVTVDGTGSNWINTSGLCVGASGSASLLISNGAVVSNGVGGNTGAVLTGDSQYGAGIGVEAGSIGSVTVTGAGSTWTESGDFFVGFSGTGSLVISNGGAVSVPYCQIGTEPGSFGSVTVTGSGSTWTDNGDLSLGNSDCTGSLLISNGGAVINSSSNSFSSIAYASATVTGAGSTWNEAGSLYVGPDAGTLLISAGGRVSDPIGSVEGTGIAGGAAATVTGSGSAWTNGLLVIGPDSNGGTLLVANGGAVSSGTAYIGGDPFYPYASAAGMATVSGSGSTWTNSGPLSVGESGSGTLLITNGGTVTSSGSSTLGDQPGSIGTVTVSGSGSSWTNPGTLTIGNSGTGGLIISRSASVISSTGDMIIGAQSGSMGVVTISGRGSSWYDSTFYAGSLYVGYSGVGTIVVSNGAALDDFNSNDYVGYMAGSRGVVTVSGSGSSSFGISNYIGYYGAGALVINESGSVANETGYVGYNPGSNGTVTVSGRGSIWNSDYIYVGYSGTASLVISNGGAVSDYPTNNDAMIGYKPGSSGSVTVTGSGSTWFAGDVLFVGESGTGSLLISAGATVSDYVIAQVGFYPGSNGRITVTGTRSTWSPGDLELGVAGAGSLLISNGGSVSDSVGVIAESGGSGTVTVSGSGSTWTNVLDLIVGQLGTGTLVISNGGAVISPVYSSIGGTYDGVNSTGTVIVGGSGSTWSSGQLTVGEEGTGSLLVNNGASVSSTGAVIGDQAGSKGSVTVSGSGSSWTDAANLTVSNSGTGTLAITNGGLVSVAGTTTLGNHGTLQFDGSSKLTTGSLLINGGTLRTLSPLTFSTSATLDAAGMTVDTHGFNSTFWGNFTGVGGIVDSGTGTLTLTGSSTLGGGLSIWSGGSVQISGNGFLSDATGTIATTGSSAMTVSGNHATWKNTGNLIVGDLGNGTLNIAAGATVTDHTGFIGAISGSSGSVTVSGTGSSWTNTGNFYIGTTGPGTLSITGGAIVSASSATTLGSAGTLQLDGASTFQTGSLTINGGTIATLGALTFAPSASLGAGGVKINTNGLNSTFTGAFGGAGGLAKSGSGALTLTGASTYTGATAVTAGTLALTTGSSHTATLGNTAITVASGATLSPGLGASPFSKTVNAGTTGTGSAGATLTLAPGSALNMAASPLVTFNLRQEPSFSGPAFTIGGASGIAPTLTFNIGNAASGADLIDVTKTVKVLATGGKIAIDALAGDTALTPGSYDLITSAGGFTGSASNGFTLASTTLLIDGATYDFSLAHSTVDDEILTVSLAPSAPSRVSMESAEASFDTASATSLAPANPAITTAAVPEPGASASLLSAFGLAAASLLRRRKR